jgi:hypothetical protein
MCTKLQAHLSGLDWERKCKLYVIAAAGPNHAGKPAQFEDDYDIIVRRLASLENFTVGGEVLFWLGGKENDETQTSGSDYGVLDVTSTGDAYVWHH